MTNEVEALRSANDNLRKRIRKMEAEALAYESHVLAQYATYDINISNLRKELSRYRAAEAEAALKALEEPPPGVSSHPAPSVVH